MVDRGADLRWLSQYPHEAEILFPPLTGLEVQSTRVDEGHVVAELRLSVNLTNRTLEQVCAGLQHSHLDLLDLLLDAMQVAGVPTHALLKLTRARARASKRDPAWFNDPSNFRASTNEVLNMAESTLLSLPDADLWAGEVSLARRASVTDGPGRLQPSLSLRNAREKTVQQRKFADTKSIIERLQACAVLCARSGLADEARRLLLLATEQVAVPPHATAHSAALTTLRAAIQQEPGLAALIDADAGLQARLVVATASLGEGIPEPWPAMLMSLMPEEGTKQVTMARALAQLVRPYVRDRFAEGSDVFVWMPLETEKTAGRWVGATVERRHPPGSSPVLEHGGFDVQVAGSSWDRCCNKPPAHVIAKTDGGPAALLRAAASAGCVPLLAALLAIGVSVFEAATDASTALHNAAAQGHADCIHMLVAARASPEMDTDGNLSALNYVQQSCPRDLRARATRAMTPSTSDKEAYDVATSQLSPLMLAIRGGDVEAAQRMLLEGGAATAAMQSAHGCTALGLASEEGLTELIPALVETGCVAVDTCDAVGASPLILACYNGHVDAARALLDAKAAVDLHERIDHRRGGQTSLQLAAQQGYFDVAEMLISRGADVNAVRRDGQAALAAACKNGHADLTELLIRSGANIDARNKDEQTALHGAAKKGHAAVLRHLLMGYGGKHGADVNTVRKDGSTALLLAAHNGHSVCVLELLNAHADPNQTNKEGLSPLLLACRNGHEEVVGTLCEAKGIHINQQHEHDAYTINGVTALIAAAKHGHRGVVQQLVLAKADCELAKSDGNTALIVALARGHETVAQTLLNHGVSTQGNVKQRFTVLHAAAAGNVLTVVRDALANGADVNVTSGGSVFQGFTPLHYASRSLAHQRVVKTLLAAQADVHAKAYYAREGSGIEQRLMTPLEVARVHGQEERERVRDNEGSEAAAKVERAWDDFCKLLSLRMDSSADSS